jgi:hypothetical protein
MLGDFSQTYLVTLFFGDHPTSFKRKHLQSAVLPK